MPLRRHCNGDCAVVLSRLLSVLDCFPPLRMWSAQTALSQQIPQALSQTWGAAQIAGT